MWIDQHLRSGLLNFNIVSFKPADTLQLLISRLQFGLGDGCWIKDQLHIVKRLYYKDIFTWIEFFLAHDPFQTQFDLESVRLADSESSQIYSKMNTGDW
jgi:hypothetical protein